MRMNKTGTKLNRDGFVGIRQTGRKATASRQLHRAL